MEPVQIESDDMDAVDALAPGTRLYLVRLLDPGSGLIHSAATTLSPEELLAIDTRAEDVGMSFAEACLHAVAGRVAARVKDIAVNPEELEIHTVSELSRRELAAMVEYRDEQRATREVS